MKLSPRKPRRNLKPRPPVTAAPVTFTDLTSFDLVGLNGRQLRDIVAKHAIKHTVLGQRVVVRVDDWLAAMDRLCSSDAAVIDDEVQPQSADEVLALVGMRRSA